MKVSGAPERPPALHAPPDQNMWLTLIAHGVKSRSSATVRGLRSDRATEWQKNLVDFGRAEAEMKTAAPKS
jgi:hypothetical protein